MVRFFLFCFFFVLISGLHEIAEPCKKSIKREPVSECSILFEIKKGENFNHRNIVGYFAD